MVRAEATEYPGNLKVVRRVYEYLLGHYKAMY